MVSAEGEYPPPIDATIDTHGLKLVSYTQNSTSEAHYEGSWDLAYDDDQIWGTSQFLRWTIGNGFPNSDDSGVDVLLSYPGALTKGVIPIQACLYVHRRSGRIMVEGVNDKYPVRFMLDNEGVLLGTGQSHTAYQPTNHFFIGEYQFSLTYPHLDDDGLEEFRQLRDEAFKNGGLVPPDSRIPLFPQKVQNRQDMYISSGILGAGGCAFVELGINIKTGEPCALKELTSKDGAHHLENMNEVEISTKYTVSSSVMLTNFARTNFVKARAPNTFRTGRFLQPW